MKYLFFIFFFLLSLNSFSHHPGHKVEAIAPYPSINLEIVKDSISGYNLFINIENFIIDPSNIGKDNQNNTGYLNLFVNDIKIGRVYSNWFHIPERFFNLKENYIKVTLNANLHDTYTIKGEPISAELKINYE